MTVVNFNKLQKQEYEFLDTLDLMSIIDKDTDVYSNTKRIENLCGEKYQKYIKENNMIPDEFILNAITAEEFADYFCKRYSCRLSMDVVYFFEF